MDKLLIECLKKCVTACQAVIDNGKTISDRLRASLKVCVTACQEAIANPTPGNCSVAQEEAGEVVWMLRDNPEPECSDAAIACMACAEATYQRQSGKRSQARRIFRYIRLDKCKIDRKARTVPLSFSSEYPALQRADENISDAMKQSAGLSDGEVYVEVLDHSPENVDLSMIKNRGAFLDEHDEKDQIGVVEEAEIDGKDRIGRAVVKLDTHEKAETRLGQMESDSRPHISAGYRYTRFLGEDTLPNGRKAKRFAWKALELSSVAIPADPTIGVARSYQDLPPVDSQKETKADKAHIFMAEKIETQVDEKQIRSSALVDFKARAKEISTIADELIKDHGDKDNGQMREKIRSMASLAIQGDETVDAFKARCMADVLKAKPAKPLMLADVTDDPARYSLQRGIQSAFRAREKGGAGIPDGLEGEVHAEIIRKAQEFGGLGYEAQGFQVPHNATLGGTKLSRYDRRRMQRDSQATVFAAGGAMVATQLVIPVIELLRNRMVLEQSGFLRVMSGLQGNIVIPRQEAAATAYSVSEIGALKASQQILGQIALTPKRVGSTQSYSKQLVMQSSPDAEAFIRDDHFKVIALQWDYLGLAGQGVGDEPLGIMNTPGVQSILFGATPTYAKIVAMETALRSANVTDPLCFLSTPSTKGSLKTVAEALTGATTIGGSANALWKGNDTMNGYPAIDSNQIPNHQVILGAEGQAIQGLWGGLDVVVDIYTKAANAEVVVTFNTWGDFTVRHPQAFIVSADAGNQ